MFSVLILFAAFTFDEKQVFYEQKTVLIISWYFVVNSMLLETDLGLDWVVKNELIVALTAETISLSLSLVWVDKALVFVSEKKDFLGKGYFHFKFFFKRI